MSNEITSEPEIRFKGYAGDWEQRKWYDTVNMSTDMVDPKEGEYDDLPHIGPGNIESFTGRILNNVKTVREDNLISGKFHFNSGDIIYGKINPQLAKYAYVNFEGLTSADTYVLKSHNGIIQDFLFVILQTKDFYKYSVSVSMRTGMPKINRDELNQYNYLSPSNIDEQRKIGSFFNQLDNTIALHQRELDLLEQLKQTYLQKMFPKTGEDKPEIRFAGFTDAWEQRKFEGLLDKKDGVRRGPFGSALKKEFFVSNSNFVVYEQQNAIYDNYETRYKITEKKYNELIKFKLEPGDFIMSGAGTIGRISRVPKQIKPGVFNQALIRLRINKEITDPEYFIQFIRADFMQRKLTGANPGSAITNLVPMSEVKKWIIQFPILEEQKKIGNFFKQVDDTIALHQRELDSLKEMKKTLLQKMFV